jgi:hypothetical protein
MLMSYTPIYLVDLDLFGDCRIWIIGLGFGLLWWGIILFLAI